MAKEGLSEAKKEGREIVADGKQMAKDVKDKVAK